MIKIKRLNNLKILKEKKLNVQRNEVLTLVKELDKIKTINERLKNILANVKKKKITNARDLSDTNNFNIKIIDQIHVSDNRIKFLKEEIKRSRKNLGNLMQHKKVIKNKIDYLTRLQIDKIEKRTEENIPNTRKP
tara:strand:+ start:56 stop:460 length:405 start_codon:yes stop_codon:yes gene_type:complete